MKNPPLSKPLYLPLQAVPDLPNFDVLISIRDWMPLFMPVKAKKHFFWTGDSYDQPQNWGIGDKRLQSKIDTVLTVSEWHADTLSKKSGFPRTRTWPLRNGIHAPYFEGVEERNRFRLIYSSTPYRGLEHLPELYLKIKELHQEVELHVFSGYGVYSHTNRGYNAQAEAEWNTLKSTLENLPDCTVHGNVSQKQLAREYMKSGILTYPNTFEETSCISVLEAKAAGCPVVTSRKAALPETVGKGGILIEGEPGTEPYNRNFIDAVSALLSDESTFDSFSAQAKEEAQECTWMKIAQRFVEHLEQ
jgi:glycosyltransferase involved in cell wall biosynthesis